MLELISRTPEGLNIAEGSTLTPLPIDEEAASLSAVLLDEDHYAFLESMVHALDGIPLLDEAGIILQKAGIPVIARPRISAWTSCVPS
jgi:hypothetical protein